MVLKFWEHVSRRKSEQFDIFIKIIVEYFAEILGKNNAEANTDSGGLPPEI